MQVSNSQTYGMDNLQQVSQANGLLPKHGLRNWIPTHANSFQTFWLFGSVQTSADLVHQIWRSHTWKSSVFWWAKLDLFNFDQRSSMEITANKTKQIHIKPKSYLIWIMLFNSSPRLVQLVQAEKTSFPTLVGNISGQMPSQAKPRRNPVESANVCSCEKGWGLFQDR